MKKRGASAITVLFTTAMAAVVVIIFLNLGNRFASGFDVDQRTMTEDIALYYSTLSAIPSSVQLQYQTLRDIEVSIDDTIFTRPINNKLPIKSQSYSKSILYSYEKSNGFIQSDNLVLSKNKNLIFLGEAKFEKSCPKDKKILIKNIDLISSDKESEKLIEKTRTDLQVLNFNPEGIYLKIEFNKSEEGFVKVKPGDTSFETIACILSNQLEIPLIFDNVKGIVIENKDLSGQSLISALRLFQ